MMMNHHFNGELEESEWALRRPEDMVGFIVVHGPEHHQIYVPADLTFGALKNVLAQLTGFETWEQIIIFGGKEREDHEELNAAGVKYDSEVMLLRDLIRIERKDEQQAEGQQAEVTQVSDEMKKAFAAIAGVRAEIDQLSDRVAALEVVVNCGTKVAAEEFDVPAELLMRQLLKLDGIEAEGEARLQRKTEVRRVQNFHDLLDKLKATNSDSSSNTRGPDS